MPLTRTSRLYTRFPDLGVVKFTGKVILGLTGNLILDKPPMSPEDLAALKKVFEDAIILAAGGGKLLTAQKDAARAGVIAALDKDASYVDIQCNDDITILLSSGYDAISSNRAQVVLNPPEVIAVAYGQKGEIRMRIKGDPNRRAIQGRIKTVDGEFGPVITFKNSRNILFNGLVTGVSYVMQLCGLGGSTGQSDWSEPVTKVAV